MNTLLKILFSGIFLLAASYGDWAVAFGNNLDAMSSTSHEHEQSSQKKVSEGHSRFSSVITPIRHAQSRSGALRSRSDVMSEVKRRYNARVLKISLNEARAVYSVRILLPSGKVKNIQVSARR